jgi:hypothetical protein
MNMFRSRNEWRVVSLALLAAMAVAGVSDAGQPPALLAISSPSDGAIARPGQALSVTVTSPANAQFEGVAVVGEGPIGETDLVTSLPAQFSLAIPSSTSSGPVLLTAVGSSVSGETATVTIVVNVERADMPTAIAGLLPEIPFDAPGEEFPIVALADFPAEEAVDVTASSKVTYSSSNQAVAVVDAGGVVTAIAPGAASITVTYTDSGNSVSAGIPVTVPPAVFTLTPAAFDFGSQNVGATTSQQATLTNSSGYMLSIIDIQTTGDFTQTNDCVSSSPLALDATCTLTVTFGPTAIGPGEGVMTITNDNRTAGFKLTGTALARRCDANGDGVINQTDLLIIRNANGQVASGPHDPRDGNGDGSINVGDYRYCQLRQTPQ